jgi:hypothetical protein
MATTATPNLNLLRAQDSPRTRLILHFSYLQILDLLTTLAFLMAGVQEGNPVVRAAIGVMGGPLPGLIAVKTAAFGLGLFCWTRHRTRLLSRVNGCFALLVAWNLLCLILGLAARVHP